MIGPFRGGRTKAAAGIPDQPNVFYIGVVNGGVWKTTDYGPHVAADFRRAADRIDRRDRDRAVRSERHLRRQRRRAAASRPLDRRRHLQVHRRRQDLDASRACATASRSRRSSSIRENAESPVRGGRSDIRTGRTPSAASSARPTAASTFEKRALQGREHRRRRRRRSIRRIPNTVYAALWQARQGPWENGVFSGPGSGLFKSTDGGTTWRPLTKRPADVRGRWPRTHRHRHRAQQSVATVRDGRCARTAGSIARTTPARRGRSSTADPRVAGAARRLRRSERPSDESRHRLHRERRHVEIHRRRQDVHRLPRRAGRRRLSPHLDQPEQSRHHRCSRRTRARSSRVNGGETWSSWYNQPTAQFYHVTTDNAFPYRVCGGQQESGSACVAEPRRRRADHVPRVASGRRRGIRLRRARSARSRHRLRRQGVRATTGAPGRCRTSGRELRSGADYRVRPHGAGPVLAGRSAHAVLRVERALEDDRTAAAAGPRSVPDLTRKTWETPAERRHVSRHRTRKPTQRGVIYTIAPSTVDERDASGPAPTTG